LGGHTKFCVAFSADGFHWRLSPKNPIDHLEPSGVTKFEGIYYLNGQSGGHHRLPIRRLVTFASADFETWSPCAALGLDRGTDLFGPSLENRVNQFEETHLGAALWNRGNVLLGIYGQWHGDPSGDRRLLTMDLGLAISHDALHFHEPIPNARFIPALEQPESPLGVGPALVQGQGMENLGERTLYWYSLWRGNKGSGVRMVTWPRDRFGALEAFAPTRAEAITCPIRVTAGTAKVFLNVGGLGPNCHLRINLLNEGFRPVAGFAGTDAALVANDGFRSLVRWTGGEALPIGRTFHLDVRFEGVRPEDARLYAIYVSEAGN